MQLHILHPGGEHFVGDVEALWCPGVLGRFEVLNKHAPLISALTKGVLRYGQKTKPQSLRIQGGLVEIMDNKAVVLLSEAPLKQ